MVTSCLSHDYHSTDVSMLMSLYFILGVSERKESNSNFSASNNKKGNFPRNAFCHYQKSIRTISEKLGSLSTDKIEEDIKHLKDELDKSRRKEAKLKQK